MAFLRISLFVIGLAAALAQEMSTTSMLSNPSDPPTAVSPVLRYNMTNSTQSLNSTTAGFSSTSLPSTSLNMTSDVTIPTMTETESESATPRPRLTTEADRTTPPMPITEKTTTTGRPPVGEGRTQGQKPPEADDTTGIIILVIIILVAVGFGIACYVARKKARRYSVDLTSRPEEANIPLSTVEPDPPVDTTFQNGLQTFESPGAASNQAQEPETAPGVKEEQKAEGEKTPADPDAESAAPAATPDSPGDESKEEAPEPSSSADAQPSVEEKTDDEGVVSNQTSMESLKETNANNSNSRGLTLLREFGSSDLLWEVVSTSV